MPFTVSHAVAVLPLYKILGKYGALSALIIGSMTPDFSYLTPPIEGYWIDSHSIAGIFFYCLPIGLGVYYVYHLLMAPVITSLLPTFLQRYIHNDLLIGKLPNIPSYALVLSLIIGAFTHIFWDFFTHHYGIPQYVDWFNVPLTSIDDYNIMPYRVLQHFSTIFGLSLLIFLIFRWYQHKKKTIPYAQNTSNNNKQWRASKTLKIFAFIVILVGSTVAGVIGGLNNLPETDVMFGVYKIQVFVRFGITWGAGGFIALCALTGIIYQFAIHKAKRT